MYPYSMNITGGKFKGRKIKTVKSNDVRPTSSKVRESLFSMLNSLGFNLEGKIFLDLFAGSSIMGLEALSRGCSEAVFVEKNYNVYSLIKKNLSNFDIKYNLYKQDAIRFLDKTQDTFDIIFIDPPYFEGYYDKVLPMAQNKLSEGGLLIIEAPVGIDLPIQNPLKHKVYGDSQIFIFEVN